MGLGALLLRYSRDYEKQADLLGAQIMARAGYDPRALAHMFETIERETAGSGGSGPQWMSSHPNPGNRTQYINKEAEALTIGNPVDTTEFEPIKMAFASLPPAKSMAELSKGGGGGGEAPPSVGTPGQPIPAPSSEYKQFNGGKLFSAAVPANWTLLQSEGAIKAVPENGYGQLNGQTVLTHGIEFGVVQGTSKDLQQATNAWLKALAKDNPELKLAGDQHAMQMSERTALATPLVNPSPLGGRERVDVYTTLLANGNLFYYISVVPEKDAQGLQETFKRVASSIKIMDGR